jgi:hypothetical protein
MAANEFIGKCDIPKRMRTCGIGRFSFGRYLNTCPKGADYVREHYSLVWDTCHECGRPLTENMVEDEDWFDINNCGEHFPICRRCSLGDGKEIEEAPCACG